MIKVTCADRNVKSTIPSISYLVDTNDIELAKTEAYKLLKEEKFGERYIVNSVVTKKVYIVNSVVTKKVYIIGDKS